MGLTIDYYLMHNVSGYSEAGWLDVDSFSFANKKKEEGYIKHLGLSTHADAEFLDNMLTIHPEMEFVFTLIILTGKMREFTLENVLKLQENTVSL